MKSLLFLCLFLAMIGGGIALILESNPELIEKAKSLTKNVSSGDTNTKTTYDSLADFTSSGGGNYNALPSNPTAGPSGMKRFIEMCLSANEQFSIIPYPLNTSISDKQNRKIDVTILGRTPDHIEVYRADIASNLKIEMSLLGSSSQARIESLPLLSSTEVSYLKNKKKEVARLIQSSEQFMADAGNSEIPKSTQRANANEAEKLKNKYLEIYSDILPTLQKAGF